MIGHEAALDINYGPAERGTTRVIAWCRSHQDLHVEADPIPHLSVDEHGAHDWEGIDRAAPGMLALVREHAGLPADGLLYGQSTWRDHVLGEGLAPLCGAEERFMTVSAHRRAAQTTDSAHCYRPMCETCATHGLARPTPVEVAEAAAALEALRSIPPWRASTARRADGATGALVDTLKGVPYLAALYEECGWRWYAEANAHDRSREQNESSTNRLISHDAQAGSDSCSLERGYHWCRPASSWGRAVELAAQVARFLSAKEAAAAPVFTPAAGGVEPMPDWERELLTGQ